MFSSILWIFVFLSKVNLTLLQFLIITFDSYSNFVSGGIGGTSTGSGVLSSSIFQGATQSMSNPMHGPDSGNYFEL